MSEPIGTFDEKAVRDELKEIVRRTVKDTPNALLEEEAEDLVKAGRHKRTAKREACRVGHYDRGFTITFGKVTPGMCPSPRACVSLRPLSNAAGGERPPWRRS